MTATAGPTVAPGATIFQANGVLSSIEFLVLTLRRSMDTIRAFAGPKIEKAVVEPGAVAALIEFDADVRHYDVIEEVPSP